MTERINKLEKDMWEEFALKIEKRTVHQKFEYVEDELEKLA